MKYQELGLKAGLEIHQQIEGEKLFCSCPTTILDDAPDFIVKRTLRASAGETGEVDVAAAHEVKKKKYYVYEGHDETSCLVELDEEPPHSMNEDALQVCLQFAKLTEAKVTDVIQVMRKTVVDGSNTSGFQRTALVARDGHITLDGTTITLPTICIEEDACMIVERASDHTRYRLDRLGMPLIEIATGPDIRTPEQAQQVAAHLGMLLRSTGKVKRGLGTIRQDVNVSIKGGCRVEIKGVQDLKLMPLIIEREIERQQFFITLAKELKLPKHIRIQDVSNVFSQTNSKIIGKQPVLGICLPHFAGYLGKQFAPGRRLGSELSDHAKLQGVKGLIHSDEDPQKYKLTEKEWSAVAKKLGCTAKDGFVLIAAETSLATVALQAVIDRVHKIPEGVLKEVRNAQDDGSSSYLRPMPGAARMYPETDVAPIIPDLRNVKLPELLPAKIKRFVKQYALSEDLATQVVKSVDRFETIVADYKKVSPAFIAEYFIQYGKELKRKYGEHMDVAQYYEDIFDALQKGIISKDAVHAILSDAAEGKPIDFSSYKKTGADELESFIKSYVKKHPNLPMGAMMGDIMKQFQGKADGKTVMTILKKYHK